MIVYRTPRLVRESKDLDPKLKALLEDFDVLAGRAAWERVVVTSIFRTLEENRAAKAKSIVHCLRPHRALDVRIFDVPTAALRAVEAGLKARWVYDPTRLRYPIAYSEPHGDGPHLHLQVHPNTRRRS